MKKPNSTHKRNLFLFLVSVWLLLGYSSAFCLPKCNAHVQKNSNAYVIDSTKNDTLLVGYSSIPYSLKNFDYVGERVLNNFISNDTLTIGILTRNVQYEKGPHIDFTFIDDTVLSIHVLPQTRKETSIVYNKAEKKFDTLHVVKMIGSVGFDALAPKCKLETFKFKEQKKCPTTICYNGDVLSKCPTKDIKYKTYKGKIINRINKNGFKDGLWLYFYKNGAIKKKKYYNNGMLLKGKTFDKNGKDLHYVTESSGGIVTFKFDTIPNNK